MTEVGLVGPGRVGRALARALPELAYRLGPILARDRVAARRAAREMGRGWPAASFSDFAAVRLILVATPEEDLGFVARAAADSLPADGPRVLLHTCPVWSAAQAPLARLSARGVAVGGLLPIVSIRRPVAEPRNWSFAGWGEPAAVREARRLVQALGGRFETIAPESSEAVAAAAQRVAAALEASIGEAVRRLTEAGMARGRAVEALRPLIEIGLDESSRPGRAVRNESAPAAAGVGA